ncbi:oxidoreductase-like domain-containing protein [Ideonella sp. BN130291]|uniref:oxidoreductase-like domain-containing protein n=1 Tax=Ideonella sp. BN130291 TaxID=3112940 RepID=UPI002E2691B7|nr:oxidoreductase-like domain-containing protein [Ideonella sp. BN130291]
MPEPSIDDDPPPKEPVRPDDDACCGNGCDPCVFDFYEQERQQYFAQMRAWCARRAAAQADAPAPGNAASAG